MLFAFCTQKGGVGKSTIAVQAAIWLAEKGFRIGFVDADAQMSSTLWLKEACPEMPVFRLLTPDDVLNEIPKIQSQFDHIIVDGPGALSEVNRVILLLTDVAFLPCGPTLMDLRSADQTIQLLRQAQRIRKGPPTAILVPSRVKKRHRMSKDFIETASKLGVAVSMGIRNLDAYADAVGQGTVPWHMAGPRALDAAVEIQQVFGEIFKDVFTTETVDERRVENG